MRDHEMTAGFLPGMLLGAALGAMGACLMAQDERQLRRTGRRLSHGAERTLEDLDRMICRCAKRH